MIDISTCQLGEKIGFKKRPTSPKTRKAVGGAGELPQVPGELGVCLGSRQNFQLSESPKVRPSSGGKEETPAGKGIGGNLASRNSKNKGVSAKIW